MANLDKIFKPESIALIGASNMVYKWGSFLLTHMLGGGFPADRIYPVNPKEDEVHGIKAYRTASDLPEGIDLAIIATPAPTVPDVLKECSERGIKDIVVVSSNFSETGEAGASLEKEITEICEEQGLTLVGPNTMGIMNTSEKLYAIGTPIQPKEGSISFISQSGNVGAQILGWALNSNIGLAKFVGNGNEASLCFEDYIEYFANDDNTKLILAYMEGVKDGRKFIESAKKATRKKPVVVLKSGRTEEGSRAVSSHTGALSGSDKIYDSAFRQSGIVRADTTQELLDLAKSFIRMPVPKGNRTAIVTLGGGWGVLATDAAAASGLDLAPLDAETENICNELLPEFWSHGNPVDLVGNLNTDNHLKIIESLAKSPNYDIVFALGTLGTTAMIGLSSLVSGSANFKWEQGELKSFLVKLQDRNTAIADTIKSLVKKYNKPIFLVELQFLGDDTLKIIENDEIVIFSDPERASTVVSKMLGYYKHLEK